MLIKQLLENDNSRVKWAIQDNIIHGTKPFRNRIINGTFDDASIVWVDIEDVFKHTESDFTLDVNDPKGGKNSIGDRVSKAKAHFMKDYMNPSEIGYSSWTKSIVFSDGRHRLVAAYQLGERFAPVIVPNSEIASVKSLVKTGDVISFDYMKEVLTGS